MKVSLNWLRDYLDIDKTPSEIADILTSLGLAKEVVGPGQLALIEEALAALAASLEGDYDASRYFSDLQPK